MGHSSVAVTDGCYADLFRDAADADMEKLDTFIEVGRLSRGRG